MEAAAIITIGVPLLAAGLVWAVMSNPQSKGCKGFTIGDRIDCWVEWFSGRSPQDKK